jgi:hypothetical protein
VRASLTTGSEIVPAMEPTERFSGKVDAYEAPPGLSARALRHAPRGGSAARARHRRYRLGNRDLVQGLPERRS